MRISKQPRKAINSRIARRKLSRETLIDLKMDFAIAQANRRGW